MTGRRTAGAIAVRRACSRCPGVAEAKTKTVNMGIPPASRQGHSSRRASDVNDFFPHGVTINKGDKVKFLAVGLPLVRLPGARRSAAAADLADRPEGRRRPTTPPASRSGSTARTSSASPRCSLLPATFGKKLSFNGSKRIDQRPAARRQAQADHRDLQEDRQVHVLLQHPRRA